MSSPAAMSGPVILALLRRFPPVAHTPPTHIADGAMDETSPHPHFRADGKSGKDRGLEDVYRDRMAGKVESVDTLRMMLR